MTIDGIYGANQFLQFRNPGRYTVAITAMLGEKVEQAGERVNVSIQESEAPALPIIWATLDRYQPRTVALSVANAATELAPVRHLTPGASATERPGPATMAASVTTTRTRWSAIVCIRISTCRSTHIMTTDR